MSHETIPLMKDTEDDIEHGVMLIGKYTCATTGAAEYSARSAEHM